MAWCRASHATLWWALHTKALFLVSNGTSHWLSLYLPLITYFSVEVLCSQSLLSWGLCQAYRRSPSLYFFGCWSNYVNALNPLLFLLVDWALLSSWKRQASTLCSFCVSREALILSLLSLVFHLLITFSSDRTLQSGFYQLLLWMCCYQSHLQTLPKFASYRLKKANYRFKVCYCCYSES